MGEIYSGHFVSNGFQFILSINKKNYKWCQCSLTQLKKKGQFNVYCMRQWITVYSYTSSGIVVDKLFSCCDEESLIVATGGQDCPKSRNTRTYSHTSSSHDDRKGLNNAIKLQFKFIVRQTSFNYDNYEYMYYNLPNTASNTDRADNDNPYRSVHYNYGMYMCVNISECTVHNYYTTLKWKYYSILM